MPYYLLFYLFRLPLLRARGVAMDHIMVSLLSDSLHFPSAVLQSHSALPPPHLQEDVIVVLLWEVVKGEWVDLADPLEGLIFHVGLLHQGAHIHAHCFHNSL